MRPKACPCPCRRPLARCPNGPCPSGAAHFAEAIMPVKPEFPNPISTIPAKGFTPSVPFHATLSRRAVGVSELITAIYFSGAIQDVSVIVKHRRVGQRRTFGEFRMHEAHSCHCPAWYICLIIERPFRIHCEVKTRTNKCTIRR